MNYGIQIVALIEGELQLESVSGDTDRMLDLYDYCERLENGLLDHGATDIGLGISIFEDGVTTENTSFGALKAYYTSKGEFPLKLNDANQEQKDTVLI